MSGGSPTTGTQTTTQHAEIPDELKPLYSATTGGVTRLQQEMPLWGKTTQTLKEGATPTNISYPWVPGTQVSQYVDPGTGAVYGANEVLQGKNPFGDANYYINDPNRGIVILEPHGQPTGGYYDYSKPQYQYAPGDYITTTTDDFTAPNPLEVAGASPLQMLAEATTPLAYGTPEAESLAMEYAQYAPWLASQTVEPEDIQNSELLKAYRQAFESNVAPMIENQMGMAGLGTSSSLANALSRGWAQMAPQAIESEIARREAEISRASEAYGAMVPQLAALGGQETSRLLQAINAAQQVGGTMRGIEQEEYNAAYQDFLRRQALAEEALFTPLGLIVPSSIGQTATTTTSQSGGGGLFK